MFETIAALCVVLGAIVLLRTLIVRLGGVSRGAQAAPRIRIVETTPLGMKQRLHLVEVDGSRLLLGVSEAGIHRLARLPADAPQVAEEGGETGAGRVERRTRPRLLNVLGTWSGVAWILVVFGIVLGAPDAMAQQGTAGGSASGPLLSVSINGATAPDQLSDTLKIVLVLTAISVAPSILLMATCFTRILIVLALLRQAVGTATLPPNQVLVGLALLTTVYVMTPVGEAIYEDSVKPYMAEEIGGDEAITRGLAPIRGYLLDHTREEDLSLFVEMRGGPPPDDVDQIPLPVLMPAFMISEIRTAFEIGFMIYLPFLVVDLVIASMLISLGMIMLPPVMIALPFKLMLFVLVDGWNLTLSALVSGLQ
ncbi:MAG TPA: flagellar biosynthesis protein FliP [Deltaproteobacteria bacterium]|nr:flagellar biosynthesis protein FliP [Deltaproteobacteria bacterium]